MPIGVGRGLALLGRIDWSPKGYVAVARVGVLTDTLDAAGETVARSGPPWPTRADWERTARFLTGRGAQIPPRLSSIKQGGQRAYARARRGEGFVLPPRPIHIHMLAVQTCEADRFQFAVEASSGTYVRALVRDWGIMLGQAAHLTALVRTRAGPFQVADAVTLEELAEDGIDRHLLSWRAVWDGPVAVIAEDEAQLVDSGRWPVRVTIPDGRPTALVAGNRLRALASDTGHYLRVFPGGLG